MLNGIKASIALKELGLYKTEGTVLECLPYMHILYVCLFVRLSLCLDVSLFMDALFDRGYKPWISSF